MEEEEEEEEEEERRSGCHFRSACECFNHVITGRRSNFHSLVPLSFSLFLFIPVYLSSAFYLQSEE